MENAIIAQMGNKQEMEQERKLFRRVTFSNINGRAFVKCALSCTIQHKDAGPQKTEN